MKTHLWKINKEKLNRTNLAKYSDFIKKNHSVNFSNDFDKIWKWSVDNPEIFWKSIWDFTKVKGELGNILLQEQYKLNSTITTGEAYHDLAILGSDLVIKTLNLLDNNKLTQVQQNSVNATLAPKISPSDCLIDWNKSALIIHNQIRGLAPKPGAFTYFNGMRIKILRSNIQQSSRKQNSGSVVYCDKKQLIIQAGDEHIKLLTIQREGKNTMETPNFLNGVDINIGDKFRNC